MDNKILELLSFGKDPKVLYSSKLDLFPKDTKPKEKTSPEKPRLRIFPEEPKLKEKKKKKKQNGYKSQLSRARRRFR